MTKSRVSSFVHTPDHRILLVLLFFITIAPSFCQRVLLSDPGVTRAQTRGPIPDVYGPVNITTCSSIRFEMDYSFSLPWEGSGNMETSDECNFGMPCAGDPNNPLAGNCTNCWDFLWAQFIVDGGQVGGDLIGEAGTTDAEQNGTISLDYCTGGMSATASINTTMQTWAADEAVTTSAIMILCYEGVPTAMANPSPLCQGDVLNLNGHIIDPGVVTDVSWTGPGTIDDPTAINTTVTDLPAGPATFTLTTTDVNGCMSSDQVMVIVHPKPMSHPAGPLYECSNNGQGLFDLTTLNSTINGGTTDMVQWYRNAGPSGPIVGPQAFMTASTKVYAVVNNGFCDSDPIEVELIVEQAPRATQTSLRMCEEVPGSGIATFDLTTLDDDVLGGQSGMTVKYFSDPAGTIPVNSPYQTQTTSIFAKVINGKCESLPVEIKLIVIPKPLGNTISIEICEDLPGSDSVTIDLSKYIDSIRLDMSHEVTFYSDVLFNNEIIGPFIARVGTTIIYAQVSNTDCNSDPIEVTITVLKTPTLQSTSLAVCEDPPGSGLGKFELDSIVGILIDSQTNVIVHWFADSNATTPFGKSYSGGDTLIYVQASNGICVSDIIPIELKVIPPPDALPHFDTLCSDENGKAYFDLDSYASFIALNPTTEDVNYAWDSLFTLPVSGIVYVGDTTLWARVSQGACVSKVVPIQLRVIPGPNITMTGDLIGCDSIILPQITGSLLTGNEAYFSDNQGGGMRYEANDVIKNSTTLYVFDENMDCSDEDTLSIQIVSAPKAGDSNRVSACAGSEVDLFTTLVNADLDGSFEDMDQSMSLNAAGIFNTTGKEGQSFAFLYVVPGQAPCGPDSTIIIVDVVDEVSAGLDTTLSICLGDSVLLTDVLRNGDAGGLFSEMTPSGGLSGIYFFSTSSGTGNFTLSYEVGDGLTCPKDDASINILVMDGVAIDGPNDTILCDFYVLPPISGTNTQNAQYYTEQGGNGTTYRTGDTLFSSTDLYAYGRQGNCEGESFFHVTVLSPSYFQLDASICRDSFIQVGMERFDTSRNNGMVILNGAAASGCDSIVDVQLRFFTEAKAKIETKICGEDFVMVNGVRYDINRPSGTEVIQGGSANGCDSTIQIDLSFYNNQYDLDTTLCTGDFLMINGIQYDQFNPTGTDTMLGVGQGGCDSIINVHLSFRDVGVNNIRRSLCLGQSMTINGKVYDENHASGRDTLYGAALSGCDSILMIDLTFHPSSDSLIRFDLCEGDTVFINGTPYHDGLLYSTDTLAGASQGGCDSVIIVDLNLIHAAHSEIEAMLCPEDYLVVSGTRYDFDHPSGTEVLAGAADNGCDSIIQINLSYENFTLTPDHQEFDLTLGDSVRIQFSTDLNYTSIIWSSKSGVSCTDCLNPVIKPLTSTTYFVEFVDENGCRLTATIVIRVRELNEIYIPNAFSPNGDNINDRFKVFAQQGNIARILSFRIFDRWGEVIYSESNTSVEEGTHLGWDGRFNDKILPPDVFVYYVSLELVSGRSMNLSGSITLIR